MGLKKKKVCRSIYKGKKGQHPATMIFYYAACFLFAGFVLYTYIKIAYTGAKSTEFNKEYFVNDIGLMTDTIYSVPGGVSYDYRKNPSKFVIDFRDDSLYMYTLTQGAESRLKETDEGEKIGPDWSMYRLLSGPEKPFTGKFTFPHLLGFRKKEGTLRITQTGVFNEEEDCPSIDTAADMKKKAIFIDPGQSEQEKGYTHNDIEEWQLTSRIAESIKVLCESISLNCMLVPQKNVSEKNREISASDPPPDMMVSIHIGKSPNMMDRPLQAIIPTGSERSEKLACLIKNRFRGEEYAVLDTMKVKLNKLDDEDQESVLQEEAPSVQLEIGNIRNKRGFSNEEINNIAGIVLKGIIEYYGGDVEEEDSNKDGEEKGPDEEEEGGREEDRKDPDTPSGGTDGTGEDEEKAETRTHGQISGTTL
ncbi:MAG: N-acetylmuramoyl-L-alanine amidase [Candidatus Woesearchaeota archaeon]